MAKRAEKGVEIGVWGGGKFETDVSLAGQEKSEVLVEHRLQQGLLPLLSGVSTQCCG